MKILVHILISNKMEGSPEWLQIATKIRAAIVFFPHTWEDSQTNYYICLANSDVGDWI